MLVWEGRQCSRAILGGLIWRIRAGCVVDEVCFLRWKWYTTVRGSAYGEERSMVATASFIDCVCSIADDQEACLSAAEYQFHWRRRACARTRSRMSDTESSAS